MSTSQVLLVLLSGLGVFHGLLVAIFLWFYPKGLAFSNKILSFLLLILSFRIGKSVILEFVDDIYIEFIFIGLASLLLVGPLFYFYTRSVLEKTARFSNTVILHFIPAVIAGIFGLWINMEVVNQIPKGVFVTMFGIYYGHYLLYLFLSYRLIRKEKNQADNSDHTVSIQWLTLLSYTLAALWVVYVLNLLEESIPYILGPILYSAVVYGVSFVAIKKGYLPQLNNTKYKTTPLPEAEVDQVFERIKKLFSEDQVYKNPDLTLGTLSKMLKVSPQKLSMSINLRFKSNLNGFINHYRIKEAQKLMKNKVFQHHTIASIAYEVGFNSLTSFNSAFKKEMGQTPSIYRKELKVE